MLKIGSHVGMSGPNYLLGSVCEALSYQANTFMFYTGAPQNSFRTPLEQLKIDEAKKMMQENHIDINDVVVHAPYLINLGNLDPEKSEISFRLLLTEMDRTAKIGAKYLVLHPGASLKFDRMDSIKQIASYLNKAIAICPSVMILLETMAGKGSEIGKTFDEIAKIIELIENKACIGVCLDTCHIHDGGYDLNNPEGILMEFEKTIGLSYLKVCHINDSKNICNAHKDRHANIGYGMIGFDRIINFIYQPQLSNIIFILETPYVKYEDEEFPPYRFEIESIRNKTFNESLYQDIYRYYKK